MPRKKNKESDHKVEDHLAAEAQDTIRDENHETDSNFEEDGNNTDPLIKLKAEMAELNDKFLRLYSEFDNYRKRTMRERADLLKTASSGLITQLLPIMDDFERANASFGSTTDITPIKEGITLIYNKFKKVLEQKGLQAIKSTGEPFDTDLHEAIVNIPAPTEELKGKVVEEIEKGYLLNGTVIRFAKVAVGN